MLESRFLRALPIAALLAVFGAVNASADVLTPAPFSDVTTNSLRANWGTDYVYGTWYFLGLSTGEAESEVIEVGGTIENYYDFSSLVPNTTYYFAVSTDSLMGFIVAGEGATLAEAPSAAVFTTVYYSSVAMSWSGGTNPLWTAYEYDVSLLPGFGSTAASGSGTGTGGWLTGLTPNTTYYGRVRAVNSYGVPTGYAYTSSVKTLAGVDVSSPTVPGGLYAGGVSSSAFTLNWSASTDDMGVAGYRLDVSSAAGFSPFLAGYNNLDLGNVLAKTITGLAKDTTYYARLRAYDAQGNTSLNSASLSTATLSGPDVSSPTAPGGLYVSGVSSSVFTLNWSASSDNVGVTGYRLDLSANPGFSPFVTGYNNLDLGNVLAKAVTGLAINTTYYARLRAYDEQGNTSLDSASVSTATIDILPPSAPAGLYASGVSSSALTLNWSASSDNVGVAGYRLDVSANPGFSPFVAGYNNLDLGNVLTKAVTGLAVNTTYYARLRAYDGVGNVSGNSASVSTATIDLIPPTVPGGLYTSGVSSSVFTLNWSASSDNVGVAGYRLDLSLNPGFSPFVAGYDNLDLGNVLAKAVTGLAVNATYYARLRAYDGVGNTSADSVTLSTATRDLTPPSVPGGLYAAGVGTSAFTLNWSASSDNVGVAGYRLDVSSAPGFAPFLAGYSDLNLGNVLTRAITGLALNTTYYARLRAYDGVGNVSGNSASLSTATVDTTPPGAPAGLYASGVSSHAFTLNWSASTDNVGVAGYRLDVSSVSGFTVFAAGYNNLDLGGVLTKAVTGLAVNTTYYARLRAYDGVGNISANSASLSTSTIDLTPPSVPGGLYAAGVSTSVFTLNWSAAADNVGVTGYRLDVSTSAGFAVFTAGYNNLDLGNVLAKAVTGLAASTTYYARLRAYDGVGNLSSNSSTLSTTTLSGPDVSSPTAPSGLYAAGVSSSVFTLSWSASTDNVEVTGYRLDVSSVPGFSPFVSGYNNLNLGSVLTKAVTGLAVNTTYYARLRAYDAQGNTSANSAALSTATIDNVPPAAPGGLYAAGVGTAAFTLNWSAATDNVGVTGYRLDVSSDPGFSPFLAGYGDLNLGNVLTKAVTGLALNTTYYARLRAYDGVGNISADSVSLSTVTVDLVPPGAPSGLYATGVSTSVFTLNWSAAADNVGVAGYRLDVSSAAGFAPLLAGYNNLDLGNVLTKAVTGLTLNTTYYARLRAYDAPGNTSANSASLSTTTIDNIPPAAPAGLYFTGVSSSVFTLNWSAAADNVGVTGYRLDVSSGAGFALLLAGYNNLDLGNVLAKAVPGLDGSTTYYARLRAYDAVGNLSSNSSTLSTATLSGPDVSSPTAPSGLYAAGVSSSVFTLNWSASSDNVEVTGYRLDVSSTPGFSPLTAGYNNLNLGNVLTKAITGLAIDTTYYARLRAYDAQGNTSDDSAALSTATIDNVPPGAPGGLYASGVSTSVFTLNWSASADNMVVSGYRLDVSTSAGFAGFTAGYNNLDLGNVLAKAVTGLALNTTYYARLRAYDGVGNVSANSASLSTTTVDLVPPGAPGGLYAAGVSSSVFTLNWSASSDNVAVTGYRLDVSSNPGFSPFAAGYNNLDLGNVLTKAVTGLTVNTTYYARLRAYDAPGNTSADSAVLSTATIDITPPGIPAGLYANGVSSYSFTLNWSASADNVGVAGYRLDVSSEPGFSPFLAGYADLDLGNILAKAVTGLAVNTTYYARLRAYDGVGNLSADSVTSSTATRDLTPPGVPAGLYVSGVSTSVFTLNWSASSDNVGVAGYRLDVSTSAGFAVFTAGYNNLNLGDVLTKAITGLALNATYYARLRAYDGVGNVSANSASLSTTTVDLVPPAAPGGLYASGVSSSAFTLNWSASSDNVAVTGYRLDVSTEPGFSPLVAGYGNLNLGNVLTKAVTGLAINTTYYARLRAYDAPGNTSADSAVLSTATIDTTPPAAPGGLYASGVSSSAFTLNWSASTDNVGVAGYRLDVSTSAGFGVFTAGYNNLDLGNMLTAAVAGLAVNTTYYARLRAYDGVGNISGNSVSLSTATRDTTPPAAPGGPYSGGVSSSTFTLSWDASTDNVGVAGYRLDVSTGPAFTVFVSGYSNLNLGNVLTKNVTGLTSNTVYYARLRAYDGVGNVSPNSAALSTTTYGALAAAAFTNVSSGALTLNWGSTFNPGTLYHVSLSSLASPNLYVATGATTGAFHDFAGLDANTTYYGYVSTTSGSGYLQMDSKATLAVAPANTAFTGVVYSSAALSWQGGINPAWTVYQYQLSVSPGFGSIAASGSGAVTAAWLTGLAEGTTYYGRVRAMNSNGVPAGYDYTPSSAVTMRHYAPPTGTVSAVSGAVQGVSSITWSWGGGTVDAASYYALYSRSGVSITTIPFSDTVSYEHIGLASNTAYALSVAGRNAAGDGPLAYSATFYTMAAVPANTAAALVSSMAAQITWSAGGNPAGTVYQLWKSTEGSVYSLLASTTGAYTHGGLSENTTYFYKVRALNGDGVATAYGATVSTRTPAAVLEVLPVAAGAAVSVSGILWSWTEVSGATGYRVVTGAYGALSGDLPAGTLNWLETGLSSNTAYARYVLAYNGVNITTSALVTAYTWAAAPSGFTASQVYISSAVLNWGLNGNPAATVAQLRRWTDTAAYGNVFEGAALTFADTALEECSTYYYQARNRSGGGAYSGYVSTITFTTLASTPTQPGGLSAESLSGGFISLFWNFSPSPGVTQYRLYSDDGTGTINYAVPVHVSSAGESSWTTAALTPDTVYKFGLRAATRCGIEEQNTAVFASAQAVNSLAGLRAAIKTPQAGKRVNGNRVTLAADIILGTPANTKQVNFQYREFGTATWLDIPAANTNHPNPDLYNPYFTHWDVSAAGMQGKTYELRAVATDDYNTVDPAPPTTTVVVDHVSFDTSETDGADGQQTAANINNAVANTVQGGDKNTALLAKVSLPADSLNSSAVTLTLVNNPASRPPPPAGMQNLDLSVKITLSNAQHDLSNGHTATLTLSYKDLDDDDILDDNSVGVDQLRLYYAADANGPWLPLDSANTVVDRTKKTISGTTSHFSFFAVFPGAVAANLDGVRVYPVPYLPNDAAADNGVPYTASDVLSGIIFDRLPAAVKIKIFTLSGQLVTSYDTLSSNGKIQWDVKNNKGRDAASGAYIAVISSPGSKTVIKKLLVVR